MYGFNRNEDESVILPSWRDSSTAGSTVNSGVYSFGGGTSVSPTVTSFNPPSQRLSPVFPLEGRSTNGLQTAIIDFENLDDVEINYSKHKTDKSYKNEPKKVKKLAFGFIACFAVFLILAIVAGVVVSLDEDEKGANNVEDNENEGEDDENDGENDENDGDLVEFCGEFSEFVETDEAIRAEIASVFDDANANNILEVNFVGRLSINCLPENVFANLSPAQLARVQNSALISFFGVGISEMNQKAFGSEVSNVRVLNFQANEILSLPDDVFENFTSLDNLLLNVNPFVTMNNNIFGTTRSLKRLFAEACPNLTEFPEFVRFTPNLLETNVANSPVLDTVNTAAFSITVGTIKTINVVNTALALQNNEAQLAALFGVDLLETTILT